MLCLLWAGCPFAMSGFPASSARAGWRLEHSYQNLPDAFFTRSAPVAGSQPEVVLFNDPLARALGLDPDLLGNRDAAAVFGGNSLPHGADPIAQAYAGHQFGHFTLLGDGRAILLGEQITPEGGRFDIQLKGAGKTPWSRGGDGRAALGPMLREYVMSEAMHALGIPTTRSLAVTKTGDPVFRGQRLDGAVLTRVAASHLRVGTFEWAAARAGATGVQALADYAIQRHDQNLEELENPYPAFLESVIGRQAALVARWLGVGFIHGVMNTDNMAISGETIDYGPCAFMDQYDPATVFSSIDHQGRYAYSNQPLVAQWNLARFAETLLPLLAKDEREALALANAAITGFTERFDREWLGVMRCKLGLTTTEQGDDGLVKDFLAILQTHEVDFTNAFCELTKQASLDATMVPPDVFRVWGERWQARLNRQAVSWEVTQQSMRQTNPAVIPRNHLVEAALAAATERQDFSLVRRLIEVLEKPYDHAQALPAYQTPPGPEGRGYQTFCGT